MTRPVERVRAKHGQMEITVIGKGRASNDLLHRAKNVARGCRCANELDETNVGQSHMPDVVAVFKNV